MSGLRIDSVARPAPLTIERPQVWSSFAPEAVLRSKVVADSYTENGFSIAIKSVSPNSLILAKEVIVNQPVEIRFKDANGGGGAGWNGRTMVVNALQQTDGVHDGGHLGALIQVNGIFKRPMGYLNSWVSCVLTINGTSFSSRVQQSLCGLQKFYNECRATKEGYTDCPPYNHSFRPGCWGQEGVAQRVRTFPDEIKSATYNANAMTDIVYSCTLQTRIPVGPFFYAAFPEAYSLTGGRVEALAHVGEMILEVQYDRNPLKYWFSMASSEISNRMCALGVAKVGGEVNADGSGIPCWNKMWENRVVGPITQLAHCVGLLPPYITLAHYQPPAWSPLQQVYTYPGMRITQYTQNVQVAAGVSKFNIAFPFIKLDSVAALYMCWIEPADQDIGAYLGTKLNGFATGAYVDAHDGASWSNIFNPIDWSSVKCQLSVQNAVLGNLTADRSTDYDQYRIYLQYAGQGAKARVSFKEWKLYNQCIVFGARELAGMYQSTYSAATLNLSFSAYRSARDTLSTQPMLVTTQNAFNAITPEALGQTLPRNYTARLVMLHPELITLSENSCAVEEVRLLASQVESAIVQGSAPVVSDEPDLDNYVS